ncbi:antibiotic biosynthesis monooxygenase [Methanolobus sp. ZRKC2]|uniref:antibiotic biosynthesis monooxygenase n=1 Tax=Methanolobus sp. ZRKC2 TaxID=3125783 RepID=UPI0032438195
MAYLLIKGRVKDFAEWKQIFDQNSSMRKKHGCLGEQVFHESGNPKSLIILFEWDNLDNARTFNESDDLKQAMKDAGAIEKKSFFLDKIETGPA